MEDLFELMTLTEAGKGKVSVRLGIRLKVAGQETVCPVIRSCEAYETFEQESQALIDRLEQMKQKARTLFKAPSSAAGLEIGPDMPAKEIWSVLSTMADETRWVAAFNELSVSQRQAVAEHVLTQCNIFSGKAAVFSRRYDSETGLM
ncbi:MAG: hypothetical protein R6X27_19645 [Candidatus Desulfacyla sp.]